MPIWGRRASEPLTQEAREGQAGARDVQEPAARDAQEPAARDAQEPAGEHQAEEAAPAFWRAQGSTAGSPAPAPAGADGPAVLDQEAAVKDPAVLDQEAAVKDPALTGAQQPAVNEDQAATHGAEAQEPTTVAGEPVMVEAQELAGAGSQEPDGAGAQEPAATTARADAHDPGISAQRWREILVAFVDDPRGSVRMAADAVDEAIDEFVNSVRARQRTLSSSWQGPETGTEQLRTAVRDYRTLWHQVRQLDLGK